MICRSFIFRGAEITFYSWVYSNWRLNYLAWDSLYTYFFALLGVEFCYYWWHRASHGKCPRFRTFSFFASF